MHCRNISEILSRELGQWMQQKAEQDKNLDIKHTDGQKVWDKPEVMEAIDDFMLRTGKILTSWRLLLILRTDTTVRQS